MIAESKIKSGDIICGPISYYLIATSPESGTHRPGAVALSWLAPTVLSRLASDGVSPRLAVTGWLTGLPANASGLTAQYIYPAVHATTPAESATDVSASTAFSWTQTPGTYSLRVTCGLSYRLTMTLAANSTTLPAMIM